MLASKGHRCGPRKSWVAPRPSKLTTLVRISFCVFQASCLSVDLSMSVAHDCSFVLDARLQSGDLVQDAKGGVRFGRKRATVKAGAPSFDLNESLLERDAGPLTVIPQNYTHAYWVWWRHSDAGAYRTLLRGSDDHSCAVKGRELGCAPSNRNAWPPNSPRRASEPRAAGLSPFRRYFCTRDGDTGGQFHSTGFSIRPEEGWQFVV